MASALQHIKALNENFYWRECIKPHSVLTMMSYGWTFDAPFSWKIIAAGSQLFKSWKTD